MLNAHSGEPCTPATLHQFWDWDPLILSSMALTGALYVLGMRAQWQHRAAQPWRISAFVGGMAALFVALVSPVHGLSEALFSAHMAQHVLLVMIAAPLLVLSRPGTAALLALSVPASRALSGRMLHRAWGFITQPASAWLLHALALWLWHLPWLYEATRTRELAHALQHASFFGTAYVFWWVVLRRQPDKRSSLGHGLGIVLLFTFAFVSGLLGALMTFATQPWYPTYALTSWMWGLTAIEDQQLAGLIMWIPTGVIYTAAALALQVRWLAEGERAEARRAVR